MLKDIPYSSIKQDKRAYEIMLLRDQRDCTYIDIAKQCGISVTRVIHIYNKLKMKQRNLYINHIAFALGQTNTVQIRKLFDDAYACYQDEAYACAYIEKKYKSILTAYRNGEPGMPRSLIKNLPPFRKKLSGKTIARVVEMREVEKASYAVIAKELHMTRAKAKHTYEMFYHEKVLKLLETLIEKAESREEEIEIWKYWFRKHMSSRKRYTMLIKACAE